MIPTGPDVTLFAPTEDLADTPQNVLRANPQLRRRKLPTLEHPALDLYAGYSDYLVKTALIRSEKWRGGAGPTVGSGQAAADLTMHLAHADQEHMVILATNNQTRLMAIHESAIGGASQMGIELRQMLKVPVLVGASNVIMVHNHPGGDPTPSRQDVAMTQAAFAAFKCLEIRLLDHVIVAMNGYYSFYEHGIMPKYEDVETII